MAKPCARMGALGPLWMTLMMIMTPTFTDQGFAAACLLSTPSFVSQDDDPTSLRVVKGTEVTDREQWPFIATLRMRSSNRAYCAASLIASDILLTAGHCVKDKHPDVFYVYLGELDLEPHRAGSAYKIADYVVHAQYRKVKGNTGLTIGKECKALSFSLF